MAGRFWATAITHVLRNSCQNLSCNFVKSPGTLLLCPPSGFLFWIHNRNVPINCLAARLRKGAVHILPFLCTWNPCLKGLLVQNIHIELTILLRKASKCLQIQGVQLNSVRFAKVRFARAFRICGPTNQRKLHTYHGKLIRRRKIIWLHTILFPSK